PRVAEPQKKTRGANASLPRVVRMVPRGEPNHLSNPCRTYPRTPTACVSYTKSDTKRKAAALPCAPRSTLPRHSRGELSLLHRTSVACAHACGNPCLNFRAKPTD